MLIVRRVAVNGVVIVVNIDCHKPCFSNIETRECNIFVKISLRVHVPNRHFQVSLGAALDGAGGRRVASGVAADPDDKRRAPALDKHFMHHKKQRRNGSMDDETGACSYRVKLNNQINVLTQQPNQCLLVVIRHMHMMEWCSNQNSPVSLPYSKTSLNK